MQNRIIVASLVAAMLGAAGSAAIAGSVVIEHVGGGITLTSGDLSSTVFGTVQPTWTNASLASVHAALNADGVNTDNKITTLLADTDHGLALLVLVDHETNSTGGSNNAAVHMASFGYGSNLGYVNDVNEALLVTPNSPTSRLAVGSFAWDSMINGDGFGWADLIVGNTLTFQFDRLAGAPLGLDDPNTFQFVTHTANGWRTVTLSTADTSFTDAGEFGFAAVVIPLPGAAALAGLPLAGVAVRRRRHA